MGFQDKQAGGEAGRTGGGKGMVSPEPDRRLVPHFLHLVLIAVL